MSACHAVAFAKAGVKKVYPLRFSAEHGQQKYEEFFHQFNDAMHK
jgi:hypothetical protein